MELEPLKDNIAGIVRQFFIKLKEQDRKEKSDEILSKYITLDSHALYFPSKQQLQGERLFDLFRKQDGNLLQSNLACSPKGKLRCS